jgi:hypothetical protein
MVVTVLNGWKRRVMKVAGSLGVGVQADKQREEWR